MDIFDQVTSSSSGHSRIRSRKSAHEHSSHLHDKTDDKKRLLFFKKRAKVKLIPSDQFHGRPVHMERAKRAPHRRLWVQHTIHNVGGFVRDGDRMKYIAPKTPWGGPEVPWNCHHDESA